MKQLPETQDRWIGSSITTVRAARGGYEKGFETQVEGIPQRSDEEALHR
jgi:hypothetical protein